MLTETNVAMVFALLGVVFSVAWLVLGLYGIQSLRDIKGALEDDTTDSNGH